DHLAGLGATDANGVRVNLRICSGVRVECILWAGFSITNDRALACDRFAVGVKAHCCKSIPCVTEGHTLVCWPTDCRSRKVELVDAIRIDGLLPKCRERQANSDDDA